MTDARRIGVDEAGKGPVLGPMVAAAVRARPGALPDGVDDSKRLAPERRASLAATLRSADGVAVGLATVCVDRIDDPETDMNGLTLAAHAEAVGGVVRPGDRVVADAADIDADRFAGRLTAALDADATASAAHGADGDDPVVGAASVLAKVVRDRRVAALAERYGRDVGSGYPSDPTTRGFLRGFVREHDRLPDCARRSWSTCDDLLAAAAQSSLSEF